METDSSPGQRLTTASQKLFECFANDRIDESLEFEKEIHSLLGLLDNINEQMNGARLAATLHRWKGEPVKALKLLEEFFTKSDSSEKLIPADLKNVYCYGVALGEMGNFAQAIRVLEDGITFAEEAGEFQAMASISISLGWVYNELCQPNKAISYINGALNKIEELIHTSGGDDKSIYHVEANARIDHAEHLLMCGDVDNARKCFENIESQFENSDYILVRNRWRTRCRLGLAELWLSNDDTSRAQQYYDDANAEGWIEKFPFRKYQVRAGRINGALLSASDRLRDAEIELKRTLKIALDLDNPTQIWKTHLSLGNLYVKLDEPRQAKTQYGHAVKVVQGIADGLTDIELKEVFLRSGPIKNLLAQAERN
ncbi:MAG: hypothetical protein IIA14_09330 [SAR324 cluster bacterium]|nr:hypothetical protein [SAR324 cluster bacterium]